MFFEVFDFFSQQRVTFTSFRSKEKYFLQTIFAKIP